MLWGGITLLILCLELPAVAGKLPIPSISETVWGLQQRWPWLTAPLLGALALLTAHIVRLRNVQQRTGPTKEDQ
jgi:hypothetical protein